MSFPTKRSFLSLPVLALALAGSLAFPAPSHAHDPMFPKIGFHFRLGLGGELERIGPTPRQRVGMEPGFGGGVELEVPLNPYFSLGGAFEAYAWSISSASGSYNVSLDFLFMPRLRIPFGAHPWHLEVYFGLPIGPTLSVPHDDFAIATASGPLDIGIGVTGGPRVGFRINVDDVVGFFIDVAPMFQYVSYPTRIGGPAFEVWHYQFVLRAGVSIGMGA